MRRIRFVTLFTIVASAVISLAQSRYLDEPGIPEFTTSFPVEHGFINLANGNLHIEIPIAMYPQRGNIKALHARLVYDSRFWTYDPNYVDNNLQFAWNPNGVPPGPGLGWRLLTDGEAGSVKVSQTFSQCGCSGICGNPSTKTTYSNYIYQEPNGTNHRTDASFKLYSSPPVCGGLAATGTAYATDNSGYKFVITNGNPAVYAPDGTQVTPTVQDTNGNVFGVNSSQAYAVVDTLGRTPVISTTSGNQVFLDYLNPQGARSRATITLSPINLATQFGNGGDYTGTLQAIQSIGLPDGTSYQFQYDSYGQITSMTLPTGGQVTYGYTNIATPNQPNQINRWVTSRTGDGNTWAFTPAFVTCTAPCSPLTITVTTPPYNDGNTTTSDNHVYSFLLGNGAWPTQIQYFRGATSGAPVLTITKEYNNGTNNSCQQPMGGGTGAAAVLIRETLTWPSGSGTLSKKAEYCYDTLGVNLTIKKLWDYQPGSFAATPDREIDNAYVTDSSYVNANIINLIKSTTTKNSAGTQVAQTTYGYDESTVQASGVTTQLNPPTGPRGNLTSTSRWQGSTTFVTSTTKWYDTGEGYQSIDPLANATTFTYDSSLAGAYPTKTCNALSQCSYAGYDFNTGLLTAFVDPNGSGPTDTAHTTTHTYDSMLRPLCTNLPDGGQTCVSYPSATTAQKTTKITSSISDVSSVVLDVLGRTSQTQHVTPSGTAKVDTTYDPIGRVATVSNPYFSTSDPTYGVTTTLYDVLGRATQVTKQDGSVATVSYSANCTTTTDEAGKPRKSCHNGFGELTEVDEPNAASIGTNATASVTISGQGPTWAQTTGGPLHLAASGSSVSAYGGGSSGNAFYLGPDQHVYHLLWGGGTNWAIGDLTSVTGNTLAASGSPLSSIQDNSGVSHVFYFDTNHHLNQIICCSDGFQNQDLTALTGIPAASAGSGLASSGLSSVNPVHVHYVGTNQHIYHVYLNSSNTWQAVDLTVLLGATNLASTGSALSNFSTPDGNFHGFYFGTNQHLYDMTWSGTSGWQNLDLTAITGSGVASIGSGLASTGTGTTGQSTGNLIHVHYVGANQHIYHVDLSTSNSWGYVDLTTLLGSSNLASSGSALSNLGPPDYSFYGFYQGSNGHISDFNWDWTNGWKNPDLTSLTGNTAVAPGTGLASYGMVAGVPVNAHYVGADQHVYHLYYSNGVWANEDAISTATFAVPDSGTVSLSVGGFTATACFGPTNNPSCVGQPVNWTAGDVASALASKLNVVGSPVSATPAGASLNLVWSAPGAFTPTASALSTTHDQPSLFANPSFTSQAATFSGGSGPSLATNPYVTLYTYDALGNLLNVTQKGGTTDQTQWRIRTFAYDSLSRLLTATNPESGTINYSYDANGNLLQKQSPAPNQTGSATQTISYCYDQLNRVTGKAYSAQNCTNGLLPAGTAVVSYTYDSGTNGIGHRTGLTDQAGTAAYTYDALGRLASESRKINNITKNLSYTYNLDGSVAAVTYPSGAVITYAPDSAGRTASAVDTGNNKNYVTGATYGPDGSLASFISGNSTSFAGITNSFSFNNRLQPVNMSAVFPSATTTTTVFNLNYDFHLKIGNNGNVWSILNNKDATRSQTFTYDSLNRLTSAQTVGSDCTKATLNGKTEYWGNSYSYDPWGNLLGKNVTKCSAENLSVTAAANNQLQGGYTYDAAGNMTHDLSNGGVNYTYDAENRITGAAGYTYTYDADGNRVEKSNGSAGTLYWYMSPGIVGESDLLGNLKTEYLFFDGERVARKDFPGNTVSYYFSDHLKTASVVTDASGTVLDESDYYPWGGELQFVNNLDNHYKFTGKERDSETNLDYFGARYYSNALGRWVSADWSATPVPVPYADFGDPQTLSLYGYVRGLPTTKADIDGHGFWRRLWNSLADDGCWCEDAELKKHQAKVLHNRAEEARKKLSAMKNFTINGKSPADFAKRATDQQAINGLNAATKFIFAQVDSHPCGPGVSSCAIVIPLGLGSTGRTVAASLEEKLAMEEVMADPKGIDTGLQMNDPRWPSSQGWVKMRQNVNGIEIHWVENTITGAVDDFKFK